jgi:5-(carboxyamino)imidazole ribonucleotide synthase
VTVAVVGGGQLGLMLGLAGVPLGLRFRFLDPSPDAPAGRVGELLVGAYDDPELLRPLVAGADAVTFEFENLPAEAAPAGLLPPAGALAAAQDRLAEKRLFRGLGIDTAPFAPVDDRVGLDAAVAELGLPAVLKTRRLGYDGKGQAVLREPADLETAWEALGGVPLLLESYVAFRRELSVLAVRDAGGSCAYWPLAENVHREGILRVSSAPAAPELQAEAEELAEAVLHRLDYVGVLAVELFDADGRLLANELAPRVHNSGHWTIDGAVTSQFENHLRAILGLPLGSTEALRPTAMVNLIGGVPPLPELLGLHGARVHVYGKAPRPGRKVGHVTLLDPDDDRLGRLQKLAGETPVAR